MGFDKRTNVLKAPNTILSYKRTRVAYDSQEFAEWDENSGGEVVQGKGSYDNCDGGLRNLSWDVDKETCDELYRPFYKVCSTRITHWASIIKVTKTDEA